MAWIQMIEEADATGELAELYAQEKIDWSKDNPFKVQSLNPPSLKAHHLLFRTLMYGKSGLSRAQREMIGVVVSVINQCRYCIVQHGEGLRRWTRDPKLVQQLIADYRAAPLAAPDRAMLDYAAKLAREPWMVRESDVQTLREAGFSDADILDIAQVVGYLSYANRLADGLGVAFEPREFEKITQGQ